MVQNVIFTVYFSISDFREKLLNYFTKISSAIMKLTRTWCSTVDIIGRIPIIKFQ